LMILVPLDCQWCCTCTEIGSSGSCSDEETGKPGPALSSRAIGLEGTRSIMLVVGKEEDEDMAGVVGTAPLQQREDKKKKCEA
jgi:hypothetical protein